MEKTTKQAITVYVEETDTYGGESNYAWVNRFSVQVKRDTTRAIVRAVNKQLGYRRIKSNNYGDMIEIRPRGICRVAFVTFSNPNGERIRQCAMS